MAIKRYKVGRSYTERTYLVADFDDHVAVRTLMETWAAADHTLEGRLADAERRAKAYLTQANMPLDPRESPYGDPTWQRTNERTSVTWYAINILNTITMLRLQIEHGDTRLAVDLALDLGVLIREGAIVQDRVGGSIRGGAGAKNSDERREIEKRNAAWREQAIELWKGPRRRWGAAAIAREIDANKERTIRRVIGDLKPS
jgi:hypothetical protein